MRSFYILANRIMEFCRSSTCAVCVYPIKIQVAMLEIHSALSCEIVTLLWIAEIKALLEQNWTCVFLENKVFK